MKKLFAFATLVCTLFVPGCGSQSKASAADTPSDVVKQFYSAINAENYTAAADCLYYDGKDVEKDKAMMVEILSTYLGPELKKLGGVKVSDFTEKTEADGNVSVVFEMQNGKGQGGKETAKCTRDASGAWKMRAAF